MTSKSKIKQVEKLIDKLNIEEPEKNEIREIFLQAFENISNLDFKDFIITLPQVNSEKYSLAKSFTFGDLKAIREKWVLQPLQLSQIMSSMYMNPINILPTHRTADIELKELDELLNRIKSLEDKVSELDEENKTIKRVIGDLLEGQNELNEKRIQYISTEIYLDTNNSDVIFQIYSAVTDFIKVIDFIKVLDNKAEKGSWYKKFYSKSKKVLTSDEVVDRLKKIEYGIEANTILKQQSEIDKNQSEALANIIKSMDRVDNGIVRIGSLLVIKITDSVTKAVNIQVRTLTVLEMYAINQRPSLLRNPESLLDNLANVIIDLSRNQSISDN